MEELSPQERFNQLLSFLKDPEGHPHQFPIPDRLPPRPLSIDDFVWLEGRKHSAGIVNDFRQEAIEILESEMFCNGLLKGNFKTGGDISIKDLEIFVLQVAAAVKGAKSLDTKEHDFDNRPMLTEDLSKASQNMLKAFDEMAGIILKHGLIRPDRLAHLRGGALQKSKKGKDKDYFAGGLLGIIIDAKVKALGKKHSIFDLANELILIFIKHFETYPTKDNHTTKIDSQLARHIFTLLKKYSGKRETELPGDDAIRKRMPSIRALTFPHQQ